MGCYFSSINTVSSEDILNKIDILYLIQSWNIIKTHSLHKFAQDVLIKTINRSPSLRQFWISKIQVEGNNYDYGQNESCLRTDLSWRIGLREHSIQLISILEKLMSAITNENHLKKDLQSLDLRENIFLVEYESFMTMKKCMLETVREHLKTFNYDFTHEHERAWQKFLTYIEHAIKSKNTITQPTDVIIVSDTNSQQHN
ncbi:unnamed protein product [Rotaria sordida]|uniref:Globin domain-containing protein n=1 Tax=Rotaria sordida TaxID=392033 RepID=A0A814TN73_9BILA|nr:unnamed protein product [Rotaria sordida]CAF1164605.1 unnamed protein product [Rotaria sordida]CAF1190285.1 unnamed protein product [Rotaria sordida]